MILINVGKTDVFDAALRHDCCIAILGFLAKALIRPKIFEPIEIMRSERGWRNPAWRTDGTVESPAITGEHAARRRKFSKLNCQGTNGAWAKTDVSERVA